MPFAILLPGLTTHYVKNMANAFKNMAFIWQNHFKNMAFLWHPFFYLNQ
jgi:hypothetical protein